MKKWIWMGLVLLLLGTLGLACSNKSSPTSTNGQGTPIPNNGGY